VEGSLIFDWLRDLLEIYTWWELWLVASVPSVIIAVWLVFSYFLEIQNSILRTASIWILLFMLMVGAGTVDAIKKRRNK
jgi:hypothetical protein